MTLTPSGFVAPTQPTQASQPPAGGRGADSSAGEDQEDEEALWGDVDFPVSSQVEGAELALLPPPIDDERSCNKCYVGDACMLFRKVRVSTRLRTGEVAR